jgi:hypothetical protein
MLSRDGARFRAFLELQRLLRYPTGDDQIFTSDEWMIERPWGWVVRWSYRHALSGRYEDVRYGGGYGPAYVNKYDGSIRFNPSAWTLDKFIEVCETEFEQQRSGL